LQEAAKKKASQVTSSLKTAASRITTSGSSSSTKEPTKPSWFPQGAGYRALTLTRSQSQTIASQAAAVLLQLAAADVPQQHLPVLASAAAWVEQQPLTLSSRDVLSAVNDIAAELVRGKGGGSRSKAEKAGSKASSSKRSKKGNKSAASSSSSSNNKDAAGAAPGGTSDRKQHPVIVMTDLGDVCDTHDQMQELAAAGYLAWPQGAPAGEGSKGSNGACSSCYDTSFSSADTSRRGTHAATTTTDAAGSSSISGPTASPASNTSTVTSTAMASSSGGSSSPMDCPPTKQTGSDSSSGLEELSSTGNRLHALAAAVVTQWRGMPSTDWTGKATIDSHIERVFRNKEQWAKQFYVVAQLLVLLVQQLPGVSAQQRGAFLCGPPGTTLLWVLREMSSYAKTDESVMELLMGPGPQQAGTGQQVQPAAAGWVNHWAQGRAVVELLLLPGLLLEPVPEPAPSGGDGVEGISSSTSGGCSAAGKQLQDASKHIGAAAAGSGSSSSSSSSGGGTSSASNMQGAGLSGATGTPASARAQALWWPCRVSEETAHKLSNARTISPWGVSTAAGKQQL
jgi:hypothetical protein